MIGAMVLFGFAAFDADVLQDMAESRGRGVGLIQAIQPMVVGGVNVPMLLVALWMGFEVFRFGWRWADQIALAATGPGIHFHGSTFHRSLPWEEVREVRFYLVHRNWVKVPTIEVTTVSGKRHRVQGVVNGSGEAERFAELAAQRVDATREQPR
jgi:hypothetical protein